jgi:type II secretory pathway component PulF
MQTPFDPRGGSRYEAPSKKGGLLAQIQRRLPVPAGELVVFFNQVAFLYHAGIALARSIEIMAEQTTNLRMKETLDDIQCQLQMGNTFHDAMKRHHDVFSKIYLTLVDTGEISGTLETMLFRSAALKEKELMLTKKIQQAGTYPVFVFIAIMIFVLLLGRVLVFNILPVLTMSNEKLPLITKIFVLSYQILSHPVPIILMIIGAFFLLRLYRRAMLYERNLLMRDRLMLSIPILGPLIHTIALSRFCTTLSTVLESGIPIVTGLRLSAESSGNYVCIITTRRLQDFVQEGGLLNDGMANSEFFSPLVRDMIRVGEEAGSLPDLLQNTAVLLESQVEYALLAFSTTLEPLLIGWLGLLVAILAYGVLSPLNSVISSLGK